MKTLIFSLLLLSQVSFAGEFKFRAREHFDIHNIDRNGITETYTGLSNTINLWYEKPYDISYGLALNPLIGSANADNSLLPELGGRIRLVHLGLELKVFIAMERVYTRLGLGWTQLRSDGVVEESNGYHGYTGMGYEFKFESFGLALEMAYRHSVLQNDIQVGSITPSLGVHFYELL